MRKITFISVCLGLIILLVVLPNYFLSGACSDPSNKIIIKSGGIKEIIIMDKNSFTRADYNNPKIDDEFDAFFKDEIWITYEDRETRVTKMGCGPMEVY